MKKIIKFLGVVTYVVLLALLVVALINSLKRPSESPPDERAPTNNPSASDLRDGLAAEGASIDVTSILGNWISDRTDENMMTLKEDGTFKDTDLMGEGTYEIRGSYLVATNASGNEYVMLYRAENDEFYYTIDKYVSVYHRATDAEVAQKMARVERRMTETEEREAECIKSAREHIVNTSWGSGTDYVAFQSNSFVWHKGDTEQKYEFEIVGASFIEGDPAGYSIELAVTLEDEPQECEYFMVLFGNEEILPSIEFSLNGETVVLPDAYRSGGTIEWDEPEESSDGTAEDQENEPEREDVF